MFFKSSLIFLAVLANLTLTVKADENQFENLSPVERANDVIRFPRLPGGRLPVPSCGIDPAITQLNFSIARRDTQFRGLVKINAIVKNIGSRTYTTNPNQQLVLLYQDRQLVAQQAFANLAPGQTVEVSFFRNWDASSPSEGEFPPSYRAVIVYDPDIFLDGNPLNDDCNNINNNRLRSGTEVNAMFR